MTYLEAAHKILEQAQQPLSYHEITQRAIAQKLITSQGLTPEASMGSRLYMDTKTENSRFIRVGRGIFGLKTWQDSTGLDSYISKARQKVRKDLKKLLTIIPPDRFEALIATLLVQIGFDEQSVTTTQYSNDGGIDVTGVLHAAGVSRLDVAVQVKRWQRSVGTKIVRELRGSLEAHQHGMIITTAHFTKTAIQEAEAAGKTPITLIDGAKLIDLLIEHHIGVTERKVAITELDNEWWQEWGSQLQTAETPPPEDPPVQPQKHAVQTSNTIEMQLFDQTYQLNSWRSLLLTTCKVLAERHPDHFAEKALTLHGRKRTYIAMKPEDLKDAKQIPGTALWVETNLSSVSIQRQVYKLLALFGHVPDAIKIKPMS